MSSKNTRRSPSQPSGSLEHAKQPRQNIASPRGSKGHTAASSPQPSASPESVKRPRQSVPSAEVNRDHTAASPPTGQPPIPSSMQPQMLPPVQAPIQSSIQPPNQVAIHPLPPPGLPSIRTNPSNAVQQLGQTWASGWDGHVSNPATAHQAFRNPSSPYPERDPRKALLLLQHTDTLLDLKNAEEKLFALNAQQANPNNPRAVKQFKDMCTTVARCRNRIQEIQDELAGGAGPSGAGPTIFSSSDSDRSLSGRSSAGVSEYGSARSTSRSTSATNRTSTSAGASTSRSSSAGGSARLGSSGAEYSTPPPKQARTPWEY